MIKQGHIDDTQAILILWFTLAVKIGLTFPAAMTADALTAAWMVALGGGFVSLVAFLPGVLLMRRFQGVSYARAGDEAAGLVLGKIAGLVTVLFLAILCALTVRELAEAFSLTLLPKTPMVVIVLALTLTIGYSAYAGIEAIGRLTIFLTPWLAVFLGVVLLGEIKVADLGHFFPFWGRGPGPALADAALRSSLYAEILILPVLHPYLRKPGQGVRVGVWAILLSAAVLTITQIVITGVFDVTGTDRLIFPLINLARLISFGRFFSRIEALVVVLWILASAVGLTLMLWATVTSLAECLRLPDHRPLVTPLAAIIAGLAFLPSGLREAATLDFEYIHRWGWIVSFGLPFAFWLLAVVRGKRRAAAGGEGGESGAGQEGR